MSNQNQKPDTMEVFNHFGLYLEKIRENKDEFDFAMAKVEDAGEITRNMAGFGLERTKRIIIDYDKDYGFFLVRRYGATLVAPQEFYKNQNAIDLQKYCELCCKIGNEGNRKKKQEETIAKKTDDTIFGICRKIEERLKDRGEINHSGTTEYIKALAELVKARAELGN